MLTHIPTHNIDAYQQVIFMLFALSSISISEHIRARHSAWITLSMLELKVLIEAIIIVLALAFSLKIPINTGWSSCLFSLVAGAILGGVLIRCELAMNRYLYRRNHNNHKRVSESARQLDQPFIEPIRPGIAQTNRNKKVDHTIKKQLRHSRYERSFATMTPFALLASALTEELIYRGFLLYVVMQYSGVGYYALFLLTALLFGLSHIFLGWWQVLIKSMMAILLNLFVLLTGNILLAMTCHVIFNWSAYQLLQRQNRQSTTREKKHAFQYSL